MVISPYSRDGALLGSYIDEINLDSAYINFINSQQDGKNYQFSYQIIEANQQPPQQP